MIPEVVHAAADSEIVKAVRAQNAKGVTLDKIQELDKKWMETTDAAKEPTVFMESINPNTAAQLLTRIQKIKPYLVEFILTDNQVRMLPLQV